ncbi:MAG: biotin--[acetyl-CoA-carboxylase] ligase [Bacteroidetes bacterium]|nr:biotin--[acetyl-CoA-carboxylase] ligase [Bacteroidota bacterium]
MHIIKLNAIDSTNSYLKNMVEINNLENYTVVTAERQNAGRGQLGTVWESEYGKNLTFSMLVRIEGFKIEDQFYLSMAISLGVLNALKPNVNNLLYVKWPNDILAEKDKLCGILIENVLSGSNIKHSIIGVGLNVNQDQFSDNLENVTSLKQLAGINFDKDNLLLKIISSIQFYIGFVEKKNFDSLKKLYLESLYKFQTPMMFEDGKGVVFLGKIIDVSEEGRLVVELENETTRKFSLKEIKFASY